jgi:WD40 repeat protein
MYNVQSARFIGTLNAQPTDAGDNDEMRRAHNSPVTAVLFDTLNRYVITGDSQGVLRFWNMQTRRLLKTVPTLTAGVLRMCLNPANDLLAVALADACVLVADIDTMNVVRRVHTGHTG